MTKYQDVPKSILLKTKTWGQKQNNAFPSVTQQSQHVISPGNTEQPIIPCASLSSRIKTAFCSQTGLFPQRCHRPATGSPTSAVQGGASPRHPRLQQHRYPRALSLGTSRPQREQPPNTFSTPGRRRLPPAAAQHMLGRWLAGRPSPQLRACGGWGSEWLSQSSFVGGL